MRNIKKGFLAAVMIMVLEQAVFACPWCRAQVKDGIYDRDFFGNFLVLMLPVVILAAIGFGLYYFDKIKQKFKGRIR